MVKVKEDLTGRVFGRWLVLEQAEDYVRPNGTRLSGWLCECSCEKHTRRRVSGPSLTNGSSQSCGCVRRENSIKANKEKFLDLTGKVYGRLTVIKQAEDYISPSGGRYKQWICKCSCEEDKMCCATTAQLQKGYKNSCGCLQKEQLNAMHQNNCKSNVYDLSGEFGIGWTSNTNEEFYFDLEDYDVIKNYCWFLHILKNGHRILEAKDKGTNKTIAMHRLLGFKNYDHANRNALDNRRCNLRSATRSQNAQNHPKHKNNTSGFIGVYWIKRDSLWQAGICVNKQQINLGRFQNKDDAIRARLNAEVKYFGEFAPQRHLYEQYGIKETEE